MKNIFELMAEENAKPIFFSKIAMFVTITRESRAKKSIQPLKMRNINMTDSR